MPLLKVEKLVKRFGGVTAVNNCSFSINDREVVGLIGPNGSGKTTVFNLITGIYKPDYGDIYFKDELISGLKVHKISRMGITRTFQVLRVFPKMTALENLLVAGVENQKGKTEIARPLELLQLVELVNLKDEFAGNLSYGQQKLLEFIMALMPDPTLILLDEPAAGLNPIILKKMGDYIRALNKEKTFIIIEHNIPFVMGICERVIVLSEGEKIAEGDPKAIRDDEKVVEAYLGRA